MEKSIYSIEEIKDIVVPILRRFNVKRAILFGSYAKENATDSSDIDIFIDSGGILNGLNFFMVYNQVESSLNKRLDMIEAIDIEKDSPIYNEIINYGVDLYEQ